MSDTHTHRGQCGMSWISNCFHPIILKSVGGISNVRLSYNRNIPAVFV